MIDISLSILDIIRFFVSKNISFTYSENESININDSFISLEIFINDKKVEYKIPISVCYEASLGKDFFRLVTFMEMEISMTIINEEILFYRHHPYKKPVSQDFLLCKIPVEDLKNDDVLLYLTYGKFLSLNVLNSIFKV